MLVPPRRHGLALVLPVVLTLAFWLVPAGPAVAVVKPVTCANLQANLDVSQSGDELELSETCTNQSFTLRANPPGAATPGIVLRGVGNNAGFDGGATGNRPITGNNAGRFQFDNLKFANGRSPSGADGGAIHFTGDGALFVTNSRFTGNQADGNGGAINVEHANAANPNDLDAAATSMLGNTFGGPTTAEGNTADGNGGAVNIEISHDNGNGGLTSNTFQNNVAGQSGGGFNYVLNAGFAENISVGSNQVLSNEAGLHGGGGAANLAGPSFFNVTSNTFEDNEVEPISDEEPSSDHFGGGLYASVGDNTARLHTNLFDDNEVNSFSPGQNYGGGGAWVVGGNMNSVDDEFINNDVAGQPDFVIDGEVQAEQTEFESEGGGLGFETSTPGTLHALNFVAAGNEVGGHGEAGGVYVGAQDITTLELVNGTVAGNQVGTAEAPGTNAGIGGSGNDNLDLRNSIVFGNTGAPTEIGGFDTGNGTVGASAVNVQFTDACVRPGVPFAGTGNICVDPKLTNPGGGDVHLTNQSLPVIDEASDALFFNEGEVCCDYEGDPRGVQGKQSSGAAGVAGNTDMGADEAPAFVPPTSPVIAQAILGVQPPPGVAPAECVRREISLVRADAKGRRVTLRGLVVRRLAGRPVSIFGNYKPGGGGGTTKLATVTPNANGEFTATVPRPSRRQFIKTRYRAQVDNFRSIPLKLPQSLSSTSIKAQGLQIELRGRVKRSLLGRRNPVVIQRLVCGRYRKVGEAKPDRNGNYVANFSVPAGTTAALFRAETRVLNKPGSRRYVKQYARAISITLTDQTG